MAPCKTLTTGASWSRALRVTAYPEVANLRIVDLKGDVVIALAKTVSDKWTLHCYTFSFFVNGSVILEVGGSHKEMQEVSDLDGV